MAGPSLLRRLGFGGPKLVDLPLAAYGKLPVYRDFIRNGSGDEAAAVRAWLDRGFSRFWDSREDCREHVIGEHAVLLRFPDCEQAVLGYLWGSHDNEGLRRFPFVLFASLSPARLDGPASAADALAQLAAQAHDVAVAVRRAASLEECYRTLRGAHVSLTLQPEEQALEKLRRELAEVTVEEYAEAAYGERGGELWPALLAFLERLDADVPVALRLPGSTLVGSMSQAGLWAALGLRGARAASLVVPLDRPRAGCVLLRREPRPDDIFVLHPEMPGYEQVEDLRAGVPGAAAAAVARPLDLPLAALLGPET